jgi:hypothetical protein
VGWVRGIQISGISISIRVGSVCGSAMRAQHALGNQTFSEVQARGRGELAKEGIHGLAQWLGLGFRL